MRNDNAVKVTEAVDAYIRKYNKTAGYNMIISRSSLMYVDSNLDITGDILTGLNEEYKKSK